MSEIDLPIAASLSSTINLLGQGAVENLGGGFRAGGNSPDWLMFVLVAIVVLTGSAVECNVAVDEEATRELRAQLAVLRGEELVLPDGGAGGPGQQGTPQGAPK